MTNMKGFIDMNTYLALKEKCGRYEALLKRLAVNLRGRALQEQQEGLTYRARVSDELVCAIYKELP